jgi:hypothetical protein
MPYALHIPPGNRAIRLRFGFAYATAPGSSGLPGTMRLIVLIFAKKNTLPILFGHWQIHDVLFHATTPASTASTLLYYPRCAYSFDSYKFNSMK